MNVYRFNPLQDPRWTEFLLRHPKASIFHTPGWLGALRRTYGYEPVVFTTSAPNAQLQNGVLFCHVNSWLTGRRLVSLPFSDHCQPLLDGGGELQTVLEYLEQEARRERWKYVELRPLSDTEICDAGSRFIKGAKYGFHSIDLRPAPEAIYRGFHDRCVRRKIRKAERAQLRYEKGHTDELLKKFHYLLLLTRRRHQLPPQPMAWYRNLIECMGDELTIHVVSKDSAPVASIITLAYKNSLVYKYGCSDSRFNNLGGTPFLFWQAIGEAKRAGIEEFDLGRSGLEDPGLASFKGHLGGAESELNYYRYSTASPKDPSVRRERSHLRQIFARMPDAIFTGVGRLLYRHMG